MLRRALWWASFAALACCLAVVWAVMNGPAAH